MSSGCHAYSYLYRTKQWKDLRAAHLAANPLCVWCREEGRTTGATVCDHILAHRGDAALFFDPRNLQSLCKPHHDGAAQRRDKSGHIIGCDVNGFPLDPNHPWAVERRRRAH